MILKDKNVHFGGAEDSPLEHKIGEDFKSYYRIAKVYRWTFSKQTGSLASISEMKDIPAFFRNYFFKDVTREYVPVTDINLTLDKVSSHKFAYICVYNGSWQPIDWGKIESNKVTFNNIGRNVLYNVMYYKEGELKPAARPFILSADGSVNLLNGSSKFNKLIKLTEFNRFEDGVINKCPTTDNYQLQYWDEVSDNWKDIPTQKKIEGKYFTFICSLNPNGLYRLINYNIPNYQTRIRPFTLSGDKQVFW